MVAIEIETDRASERSVRVNAKKEDEELICLPSCLYTEWWN